MNLNELTDQYQQQKRDGDVDGARLTASLITQLLADGLALPDPIEVPSEPGLDAGDASDLPDQAEPTEGDTDGDSTEATDTSTDIGSSTTAGDDAPIAKDSDADMLAELEASLQQFNDSAMNVSYDANWENHLNRASARLARVLADRLAFEDADASGYESGHDSGRLRGRDAVRVATGSDHPFSQQAVPDAPGRVHIMLAVDASGSMGHLAGYDPSGKRSTNSFIAHTITDAIRSVIGDRPEITFNVSLFGNHAVMVDHPHDFDAYKRAHDPLRKGTDNLHLALNLLRDQPDYQHALANRDAIIGICITDACFRCSTIASAARQIRNSASCESWLAVLAHGADRGSAEDIFGNCTVDAKKDLNKAIHSIARAIQSTIERAESIRA